MRIVFLVLLFMSLALPSIAETRRAFIVGVGDYAELSDLRKTVGDATGYSDVFANDLNFEVTQQLNPSRDDFLVAFTDFVESIAPGDQVVFVFSGHGWSDGALNYLAFRDAPRVTTSAVLKFETVSLNAFVLDAIQSKEPSVVLSIIDACRNNPFEFASESLKDGLSLPEPVTASLNNSNDIFVDTSKETFGRSLKRLPEKSRKAESLIIYSAGSGQEALDRLSGDDPSEYSVFTRSLLPKLRDAEAPLLRIVNSAREETARLAASVTHDQRPAVYSDISIDFCFSEDCILPEEVIVEAELDRLKTRTTAFVRAAEKLLGRDVSFPSYAILIALSLDPGMSDHPYLSQPEGAEDLLRIEEIIRNGLLKTRLMHVLQTKDGGTWAVEFDVSYDGSTAAVGYAQGQVVLWDTSSGQIISILEPASSSGVFNLALSVDGQKLAIEEADGTIGVWDTKIGKRTHLFELEFGSDQIFPRLQFANDGMSIWIATSKGVEVRDLEADSVRTYPAQTQEAIVALRPSFLYAGEILTLSSLPFEAFRGGTRNRQTAEVIYFRNVSDWSVIAEQAIAPDDALSRAVMRTHRDVLLMGMKSGKLQALNINSGDILWRVDAHLGQIDHLVLSPNEAAVSSTDREGNIKVWSVASGEQISEHYLHGVIGVGMSYDGTKLYAADPDGTLNIWSTHDLNEVRSLPHLSSDKPVGMEMSGDGQFILAANENVIAAYEKKSLSRRNYLNLRSRVFDFALSRNANFVVAGYQDGQLVLWDFMANTFDRVNTHSGKGVRTVAISDDGQTYAAAFEDGHVKIWRPGSATGPIILETDPNHKAVSLMFSNNGQRLAIGGTNTEARRGYASVWDAPFSVQDRVHYMPFAQDNWPVVAITDDGSILAVSSMRGGTQIWDLQNSQQSHAFDGGGFGVAISPNRSLVAFVGIQNDIRLLELATGKAVGVISGSETVRDLSFSPDNAFLLISRYSKPQSVWKIPGYLFSSTAELVEVACGRIENITPPREQQIQNLSRVAPEMVPFMKPDGQEFEGTENKIHMLGCG